MSSPWSQGPPAQRYSVVPGFERPESSVSPPAPGYAPEAHGDFSDPANIPPPHRASHLSDPVSRSNSPVPSAHAGLLNDDTEMYSNDRRQYAPLGAPAAAGAGGGYGYDNAYSNSYSQGPAQYPPVGTPEGATADDLWAMDGNPRQHYQYDPVSEKASRSSGSKKWWWIIGGVLLVVIAAGVGLGVGLSKKSGSGSSSNSSSDGGSSTTVGSGDPSKFDLDPNLHQVFWGLAYSPKDSIWPNCWANISTVTKDIQILSQLTTRLRLYGAMCNTTALVLQAIKDTKVQMDVWPAIYIDQNTTAYNVQVDAIKDAFQTYGVDNVQGVAVGNEFLLINMTNAGAKIKPSGPAYTSALSDLNYFIQDFKTQLGSWGLSKTIKVGTGDAGALMSKELGEEVDYFMANVHPWFAPEPVATAAQWTWQFFEDNDVIYANEASNQPDVYIAETGWPTGWTTPVDSAARTGTDATVANLQTFLDTYVCDANKNGTKYFYFEPFDEEWKDIAYGGVEGHWGLFNADRTLKDIKIPTCT